MLVCHLILPPTHCALPCLAFLFVILSLSACLSYLSSISYPFPLPTLFSLFFFPFLYSFSLSSFCLSRSLFLSLNNYFLLALPHSLCFPFHLLPFIALPLPMLLPCSSSFPLSFPSLHSSLVPSLFAYFILPSSSPILLSSHSFSRGGRWPSNHPPHRYTYTW